MSERSKQEEIFEEIKKERIHQDKRWGGPKQDDEHEVSDWAIFIRSQLNRLSTESYLPYGSDRKRFIKIAALAFAAIESGDRLVDEKEEW